MRAKSRRFEAKNIFEKIFKKGIDKYKLLVYNNNSNHY
jgi:hypothetical protein